MITKKLFQINAVLFFSLKITVSKNIMQHKSFQQKFFEQQVGILEWLLRDRDTEDWSNGWKVSFDITRINYILK